MSNSIIIFTDGSFVKHSNQCGYGVLFPNKEYNDISRAFTHKPLTNQRAELYAIYKGIKTVYNDDPTKNIILYTDSEYSIKSLTVWIHDWKKKNWKTSAGKTVMNQDIIKKIDDIMTNYKGKIEFIHVRSHTGKQDFMSINNDLVDKLAKKGGVKN